MEIPAQPVTAYWLQIAAALVCGGAIGLERQIRGKPMGIRTSILICLATAVFVRLGSSEQAEANFDPTRVLGQVVTGVGFLGAGVILARGEILTGVTSASVVWMLAAIGASIGLGRVLEAGTLSLVTLAVLIGVRVLEALFQRLRGGSDEEEGP